MIASRLTLLTGNGMSTQCSTGMVVSGLTLLTSSGMSTRGSTLVLFS
jgi:hypothetical protein